MMDMSAMYEGKQGYGIASHNLADSNISKAIQLFPLPFPWVKGKDSRISLYYSNFYKGRTFG